MHHALAENGIGCCNLVHMGVEVVTAEAGKVNDIRFGQCTTWRQQAVARLDLFEILWNGEYDLPPPERHAPTVGLPPRAWLGFP